MNAKEITATMSWADFRRMLDRLEAALRRETDSIHRAMVILAGIEMPNPDYPPRLWTALEDAYDALSDALGTDGCTTSDEEEAKATGRHFVIQPRGDCAKLREALKTIRKRLVAPYESEASFRRYSPNRRLVDLIDAALAAPARNCDIGTAEEQEMRFIWFCGGKQSCKHCPLILMRNARSRCEFAWAQMPYEEGGDDGK